MEHNFSLHITAVKFDATGFKSGFSYKDETYRNRNYDKIYQITLLHSTLGQSKTIKDKSALILQNKAQNIIDKWAVIWNQKYTGETIKQSIQEQNKQLENILVSTLEIDDRVDFELLKNRTPFESTMDCEELVQQINDIIFPPIPQKPDSPEMPLFSEPSISLWDKIKGNAQNINAAAQHAFTKRLQEWENEKAVTDQSFELEMNEYESVKKSLIEKKEELNRSLNLKKNSFIQEQEEANRQVDHLKELYLNKNTDAVQEYCQIVLNNSSYPDFFPKDFELEFNPDNSLLIINYTLPTPEQIPNIKDVKFIASKNETEQILFSSKEQSDRYNRIVYMVLLRSVHEIFEADTISAIDFVCINGFINHLNKATGNYEFKCIATLSVEKEEFNQINLSNIDAEACFKKLKGISANKLIDLTPVAPLVTLDKSDSRFIESIDVLKNVDESVNLAAMNWEEFEHLIREIFGKEFSENGGEVKVTQSSRDGGVDAVAFDPDPLRGGKIIIQAKRYTNVVGVSAVRDLYGTVMNEGANKGIIVTTSYFGKDAYDFAKNKPLALIDGSNLLYLLGKHGYSAKIDIDAAKRLNH